jgi:pimeloyl-ACP methyl ester carboxylesterase
MMNWQSVIVCAGILAFSLADAAEVRHPQEEALEHSTKPYTDQDVAFTNEAAHINLAGTFSVPNGKGPFPAVLLIAASGPEGRDEEVEGHHVFVVLSDYLLRKGIAVLRFDKRGVGKSTGDWNKATFDGLVADADAAFQYLKGRPEVNRRRLGVIGHSEGGSIAPAVAATDKDVAFVVAMAGSGLNGEVRICEQQAYMAKETSGASPEQQASIRDLCHHIFATVAKTPDDAEAIRRINELVAAAKADKQIKELLTPQFVRQELTDDPVKYVKQIHVPMLALIGTLDRIVPAEPYVAVMKPVLAKIPGSRVEVLNGLNHVMQTAQTGSPLEFGTIEETISPVALQAIGDWISRH